MHNLSTFMSFIGKCPKDHIGVLLYTDIMCYCVFKNIKNPHVIKMEEGLVEP